MKVAHVASTPISNSLSDYDFLLRRFWNETCDTTSHRYSTNPGGIESFMTNDKQNYYEQRAAILRYLAACPHAADTVEGVVNWWLPRQRYEDTREAIERILEELAAEGLVLKTHLPDNKVMYTCPEKKSGK